MTTTPKAHKSKCFEFFPFQFNGADRKRKQPNIASKRLFCIIFSTKHIVIVIVIVDVVNIFELMLLWHSVRSMTHTFFTLKLFFCIRDRFRQLLLFMSTFHQNKRMLTSQINWCRFMHSMKLNLLLLQFSWRRRCKCSSNYWNWYTINFAHTIELTIWWDKLHFYNIRMCIYCLLSIENVCKKLYSCLQIVSTQCQHVCANSSLKLKTKRVRSE